MIKNLYTSKKVVFSLEIFPPKRDMDIEVLYESLEEFKLFSPDFISVTYGAGGNTAAKTADIASHIQNHCHIEALAHLTCVAHSEDSLHAALNDLHEKKVHNILALRGDKPKDMDSDTFHNRTYKHASDIIPFIKKSYPMCVAAACYPEKHIDAPSFDFDLNMLRQKTDAGSDFLITQLFLDNQAFYDFMDKVIGKNIQIPISAGIMPITSLKQISTIISLSGASLPESFKKLMHKYMDKPQEMKKAGIDFAIQQINQLIEWGVDGIHLYTMNNASTTNAIQSGISL